MSWQAYAHFIERDGLEFRTEADLRYGTEAKHLLGSVLMINPGSSRYWKGDGNGLSRATTDLTFRIIISLVEKAYKKAGKAVEPNSYIKILNLFDLRESNLNLAMEQFNILKAKKEFNHLLFASLKKMDIESPWIWIGWGSEKRHPDLRQQMIKLVEQIPSDKIIGCKILGEEVGYYHPKYIQLNKKLPSILIQQLNQLLLVL